jgi:hypothetical protein
VTVYVVSQIKGVRTGIRTESQLRPLESRALYLLRDELELEGYAPGTPAFERLLTSRKVKRCQELQGVDKCESCRAYWDCGLVQQYMKDKQEGGPANGPASTG